MRKVLVLVAAVFLVCAGSAQAADKVLVFSKTAGFRHDSIPQGIAAIEAIGAANGLTVDKTEDASAFTAANLASYKAVIWLSTTGDVLNAAQQTAFESYVHFGGGYVGVHAAADTEYDWPWYGELVGAWFKSHPATQPATVDVTDRAHPSTKDLPATWARTDEWYDYRRNPRSLVHVLATLRESSYSGGTMGDDHPIAWCRQFEGGRSWYTGMGHTQESYADTNFRKHLAGGILWAAGLADGDCHVEPQPEPCEAGSDEFESTTLDCRWSTIVRPNAAKYSLSGGALNIATENGDLWAGGGSAKNLFLQKAPSGGYEFTTRVTLNAAGGGQQATLLIYNDDDNYFKLGQIAKDGGRWLEVVQEINGTPRHDATLDRLQLTGDYPATFYLRLTQTEGNVIATASPDGMNWSQVGRAGNVTTFTAPKIGLAAITNDDNFVTTAAFDWFHLERISGGEDTTPPTVTATPDGLRTSDGQFLNSATVALAATDLGSGVDKVEYALGNGAFQPYTTPVKVPATGAVRYRASDQAGNTSAIGSVTVTIATAPNCRPRAAEPGFKRLYDGTTQSLADWSFAGPGGFDPDDGGECVLDTWGGMGLLWYGKQPLQSPYTVRAEWRMYADDDNSGVFIGFPDPGDDPWKPVAEGYEIQIDPTDADPTRRTGSVYSFQAANAAALALALKPHGQWNVMEVDVNGQLIVIRLNGVEINRYTSPHPERDPSSGFFGVQNDGAGADVSYRSIQVKGGGLDPEVTPTPTPTPSEKEVELAADVPARLSIELASPAITFGSITPGIAREYEGTVAATVTSSVRNTTLTVRDAGSGTGKLANGTAEFATPLQVRATTPDRPNTAFAPLSGTPTTLLTFPSLAAGEPVTIGVKQAVQVTDRLLAGRYEKAVTFTVAAGAP